MATKIVTKNSSTASAVPTASDLVQGELAVNVADKRLFTEDNAGAIVELGTNPTTLTVTGEITANGGIALGDNDKATFGAGDDLQIYHDGSDSYIKDEGTGNLYLTTNGSTMNLQAGSDNMVKIYKDAQVEIFHDASVKLATTSTGIDVTGTATADKVTIGTSSASNGKLTLEGVDGADSAGIYFNNTTATNGKSYSLSSGNSGEFMLYDRTSSAYRLFVSSAGKLGLGTTSPAKLLHLSESADGAKLRITRAGVSEWDFSIGNTSTFTGVGSGALEIIALNGGTAEELAIGRTGVGTPYVHVTSSGVTFSGAISKGSGSFKIDHPLPEKTETHHLVHSFVESPQADNIYRGKVNLVDGLATVNIDDAAGMTEGTYVLLNTNTQCFTSNESGWTAVKGSVSGNILTITAQESCSDTISWMVVGERHDQHMLDTEWTDENGKVIVEPLKQLEE